MVLLKAHMRGAVNQTARTRLHERHSLHAAVRLADAAEFKDLATCGQYDHSTK